ncbi:MAG: hypothetical protein Q8K59_10995 [Nitrosomonas sp.]|nr:hypothetical protein [Nitrosomonas sp.]MDP1951597.1 hypothetical protein [Nitrosomonas sp.]
MVTKRGKQASRKAAARKYGFLEVPLRKVEFRQLIFGLVIVLKHGVYLLQRIFVQFTRFSF